jgi:hypothetical protein
VALRVLIAISLVLASGCLRVPFDLCDDPVPHPDCARVDAQVDGSTDAALDAGADAGP